jgi:hypothetical protein
MGDIERLLPHPQGKPFHKFGVDLKANVGLLREQVPGNEGDLNSNVGIVEQFGGREMPPPLNRTCIHGGRQDMDVMAGPAGTASQVKRDTFGAAGIFGVELVKHKQNSH